MTNNKRLSDKRIELKLVPQNERQLIIIEYLKSIGEGERRSQIWMCVENMLLASVLSESDIPETDPIFFKSSLMIHASNLHWAVNDFKKLLESHNMGELFSLMGEINTENHQSQPSA